MKKLLVFCVLMFGFSTSAFAETKLFSCAPPFSLFDQSFQQGDEVFVDVYINGLNQVKIVYATSVGPAVTLYDYADTTAFYLDLKQSSSFSEWKNETYISAVYLGSKWGAVLKWTKAITKSSFQFAAGQEQELMCTEAEYFNGL